VTDERNIWTAKVLTLFPEMFPGPLAHSLAGKALADDAWSLETVDIRDYATDRHRTVDDTPFGGGAGMVMRADVVDAAIEDAALSDAPLIYLTPRGETFSQAHATEFATGPGVTLICGRYEGIDQRVLDARNVTEISLGDFVLSGGEPAALALIDACVRLLPGVMGAEASLEEESFTRGLLNIPITRGPPTGAAAKCRTFCCPAITRISAPGEPNRRRSQRGTGGPICGIGTGRT